MPRGAAQCYKRFYQKKKRIGAANSSTENICEMCSVKEIDK